MQTPFRAPEILIGYRYASRILDLINSSRDSVYIACYIWRVGGLDPHSPLSQINEALRRAHHRGVTVYLVTASTEVRKQFQSRGVPAHKYTGGKIFHNKVAVIDGQYAIVGSHNFSNHAFTANVELSILYQDPEMGESLIKYIKSLQV